MITDVGIFVRCEYESLNSQLFNLWGCKKKKNSFYIATQHWQPNQETKITFFLGDLSALKYPLLTP